MNQLKLYKYSPEYIDLCCNLGYSKFAELYGDKVYTCLGEFAHAPGHVLMVEFGTWIPLKGMPEIYNFEELDQHPDDFSVTIGEDDE
jgi:hypothetical protein